MEELPYRSNTANESEEKGRIRHCVLSGKLEIAPRLYLMTFS